MRQLEHDEVTTGKQHFPLVVVCEDMLDPLNVGSIFRLADAMGVQHLYLVGASVAPPNRKINRTARSTDKRIPFTASVDKLLILDQLIAQGYQLIGLEITDQSQSLFTAVLPMEKPVAIWVGSENTGVSLEVLERLDFCVHIPMQGLNSSMNVVQALGMALFEWNRQRTQGQIDHQSSIIAF